MFENLITNVVVMYFFSLIVMLVSGMIGYKIFNSVAGCFFFQILAIGLMILVFPSIFGLVG